MHSSVREANLQALLLDDSEVRSQVGDLVEVYENTCAEDVRGTRLAHMVDAVRLTEQEPNLVYDGASLCKSSIPGSVSAPFIRFLKCKQRVTGDAAGLAGPSGTEMHPEATFLNKFSLRGVQYSTVKYRARNSRVLFRRCQSDASRGPGQPEPGQIMCIFLYSEISGVPAPHTALPKHRPPHPDLYVCVQPYLSPQPELSNVDRAYRRFCFAGGFLCRRELAPPIIVEPSSIISHVAVTPLLIKGQQAMHVLPMDRVCLSPYLESAKTEGFENSSCRSPL